MHQMGLRGGRPRPRWLGFAALLITGCPLATPQSPSTPNPPRVDTAGFGAKVKPILVSSCAACHNSKVSSGDLDLTPYLDAANISSGRRVREEIAHKVEAGEMPPKGMAPPPQAEMAAMATFLRAEFGKADDTMKPDPGRVVARRMNRNEYRNTIRDLLAVDFRAEKDFPTDDSGYGFDNIGQILTGCPVLMENYLEAAEAISSRAMGADPLPPKPIETTCDLKTNTLRRLDYDTVEASQRIDFDGDYTVRFGFPGRRGPDGQPVKMAFSMDGRVLESIDVETKPSKLVYFDPFSDGEMRLYLPAGDHVFRAAFQDDDFIQTIVNDRDAYNKDKNKFIGSITFIGPYPSKVEKTSRKKILICDPASGRPCVENILTNLARHAYRRPVAKAEIAGLMKFVSMAESRGESTGQGIQLALEAILVSPDFLFRIEHDPDPADARTVHRS